ncbi:MAG: hypothetical protein D4R64_18950 [Porphyromonadaceae bacterium]|nr:MAG: hypothetical protein D4R64_18950 [Porphyromonadaceae bacterium]
MKGLVLSIIYFVVTTLSFLFIYRMLKDDIPPKKKKKVIIYLALIPFILAIGVILRLFGVF